MGSNEEKDYAITKIQEFEKRMTKIEDNVNLLTNIFEEILKEFEKIKKEIKTVESKNDSTK
ncbi:MAG: hypothetical protein ACOCUR_00060 [Nanoarchaeota archaeon]